MNQSSQWSLKAKAITWALAVSVLPVLVVGTATSYYAIESVSKQIPQVGQEDARSSQETELAIQRQLSLLFVGTGVIAILSGAIATFVAHRVIRRVLNSAEISTTIVNTLSLEHELPQTIIASPDELAVLETNINSIKDRLSSLLWGKEAETEYSQLLMKVTRWIRESFNEQDVFKTTVEEVRKALGIDRVTIFRFNSNWNGTFIEESVVPGLAKMLWVKVLNPGFEAGYIDKYQNGFIRAIDDIYQADLTDYQVELLEQFTVKSSLVAPIIKGDQLFGLLVAHQCSRLRFWQQSEIDLFAQIVLQVGFALHYAKLLEQADTKADRAEVFIDITRCIRKSLNEEDVLKNTVKEVRKAISADRVIVYSFDANWYGTVIAESVIPIYPKVLRAEIKDTCFAEGYVEKYQAGRVQAVNNIYEAGLTDCHINQLETFAVKANLVAPILKDEQLFGLLIAHQCATPRNWEQPEIDLFAQVAMQVGFALDHARLLQRINTESIRSQMLVDITHDIRKSLNEEDVLKTTVDEVRKVLSADRVIVYSFDANWYGTVIAESVVPIYPKVLRAEIRDPCFVEGYVEKYQAGRVQAVNNIYEIGLTDCHINQLENYAVKANLVAPILKDEQLFGLLIAHQCSGPREWQQPEIDLFAQIAMQVGFALDHARLLQRIDTEGIRIQLLADITYDIRKSLNEDEVLKTTVEEVRKAISTDRVIIYSFDANWYGTVIAESVVPIYPKVLRAEIRDPCFVEGYVEKYQAGRVQAVNNIYETGLTDCHINQLETYAVKANLVAPILKDDQLFGLLIAHQCSSFREWQQPEINLFAQIAVQVGFALDHTRLLDQVDQAYQAAELASRKQLQQKQALQRQVSELLKDGETVFQSLSTETISRTEAVEATYNQICELADYAVKTLESQQIQLPGQQLSPAIQDGYESINQILGSIYAIRETVMEATEKVKHLDDLSRKLSQMVSVINHID
ncbi:MAG: GAF domain-containing protein [Desmonostoc vinosum HA7617-LM4]|jgi:GAF domain-containing protein|nr:GAF domain-containing protein [Desmonostoc vinosum HA7617-LM4]